MTSCGGGGRNVSVGVPDLAVRPSHLWVPEYEHTNGDIAAQVGEDLGMPPDPDQRAILDAIYAYRADNPEIPVCFDVGVIAPRQNIKTSTLEIAALTDLFVFQEPLHIWTAHLFKTAQETFKHMVQLVESNRDYRRKCRKPRTANGDEAIVLLTGEEIQFHARSKGGGRGLTARKVTLDEALFLQSLDMGALAPTLATIEEAQIRYGSSAGMVSSEVLRNLRDRGRAGGDPSLAYFEWCAEQRPCEDERCHHAPGTEGCAYDSEELWAQANPALGRRITVDTLRKLRRSMPPAEFAREFLGWWDDPNLAGTVIDVVKWREAQSVEPADSPPHVFAVDVAPLQASASIAGGGFLGDLPLGVVLENHPHTGWLIPKMSELRAEHPNARFIAAPDGPAGSIFEDAKAAGIEIEPVSTRDHASACSSLLAKVLEGRMRHRPDPILDAALAGATKRDMGDGAWLWSRKNSLVDISPLVAFTLALAAVGDDASIYEDRGLVTLG